MVLILLKPGERGVAIIIRVCMYVFRVCVDWEPICIRSIYEVDSSE